MRRLRALVGSTFTSSNAVKGRIEFHGLYCPSRNSFVAYADMTPEEMQDVLRDGEKWIQYERPQDWITLAEFRKLKKVVDPIPELPGDDEVPF